MILWIDFETKSRCNLKTKGVYNYSLDTSTEVICMSYAFDDDPVTTWKNGEPFPEAVRSWKGQIRAHNAAFERLIFWHVLEMDFALEQFYCTATQMRANCAPAALGDAARFAGTSMKKDHRGAQLIRLLSIPDAAGRFNNDPLLLQEMVAYCEQDVRAMREISKAMRDLTDEELYDYHVNERINDKGIRVDKPVCDAAIKYAEEERQDIEQLVIDITKGEVLSVRSSKMKEWVMERVGPQAKKLMETHVDGEVKYSIDKTVRANLLNLAEENIEEVPNEVADVVQCADDLWASSVAKFKKLAELADPEDERVRGAFVFAGGSATGRAASFGIQLHNMARQCAKDPDAVRTAMVAGSSLTPTFGSRVSDVLKGMIRPSLIPAPGKVFVVADWSAIEGRVNPWLANSESGFKKLDDYRKGLDPYVVNAAELYHVAYGDVTKDQRQVGKIQELSLAYLAGRGAFDTFSKAFRIKLTEEEVDRAIRTWRRNNPWAFEHGNALESAYMRAMRHPGREFHACRTTYMFDGLHLWYSLPSGRILCYPFAKIEDGSVSYAKAAWKPAADATEWPRAILWAGQAVENLTQSAANDILRYALRELDDLYYDIVMHIHDEVVIEVDEDLADSTLKEMTAIMTTPPAWADGLPLEIDAHVMTRYGKG